MTSLATEPSISNAVSASGDRLRTDIQALRGWAILLVVLQHAKLIPALKAGYLGVDVFFVVSGYLITGIVQRSLHAGTFSFGAFYLRRAKRLLPSAYVTFALTLLLTPLFLTRPEMKDFAWQMLGAVTFTGNVALWLQTGYFESAAALKPLLHVWSLSIEEQYYALLPAALVFVPRRYWNSGALAVTAFSLTLCLFLVPFKPGATFYLLPTRAWELALGSLGILALEGSFIGAQLARLFWPALVALLALPFFPTGAPHPGLDALIICACTLIVILRQHTTVNQSPPTRVLARLGDISYPLYLVHWPILALGANAWVSPMPDYVRLGLLTTAVPIAWALHHWVEQPCRRAVVPITPSALAALIAVSVGLILSAFVAYRAQTWGGDIDYANVRRGTYGLNAACEFGEVFDAKPACITSDRPRMLIWGDSYAMHLVGGIAASTDMGLAQATKTTCGPVLDMSVFRINDYYNRNWALGCLRFSRSVLAYLAATPSIEVVVMSSEWDQYLPGNRLVVQSAKSTTTNRDIAPSELMAMQESSAQYIADTIAAVRALGKRVVLVAPTPTSGFDIGRCLERRALEKLVFGADTETCDILEPAYRLRRAGALHLLERVTEKTHVPVLRLDDAMCRDNICASRIGDVFLYRDAGHLSVEGSIQLGRQLNLAPLLMTMAR